MVMPANARVYYVSFSEAVKASATRAWAGRAQPGGGRFGMEAAVSLFRSEPARELVDVARRRHLVIHHTDPFDLPSRYSALYLFTIGHDRGVTWVASGACQAGQLLVFEYTHRLGASQRWARVVWTVVVVESSTPRPGALLQGVVEPIAVGSFARYRHLSLEGATELTKLHKAFCESAPTLRCWLDKGLVGFLGQQDPRTTWELRGRLIAGYRPDPAHAAGVDRLVDAVVRLHDLTEPAGHER